MKREKKTGKKALSESGRGGDIPDNGDIHDKHAYHDSPPPLALIERSNAKTSLIRNISPGADNFFRFVWANYGVSKAKALDILISQFLKTTEFDGKNKIQIIIPEGKPLSLIQPVSKIPSLALDARLKEIDEMITSGVYYALVEGRPAKITVGYRQFLNIHTELRRKLMDTTLPEDQRASIAIMLEKFTEMFNNRIDYDREYIKRECEAELRHGARGTDPSWNDNLRETIIPNLKSMGERRKSNRAKRKKKDLINDEPVKASSDSEFDRLMEGLK